MMRTPYCALRFSAIATAMRLRVILGVSLVPSRLPPARPYKKVFFFSSILLGKKRQLAVQLDAAVQP